MKNDKKLRTLSDKVIELHALGYIQDFYIKGKDKIVCVQNSSVYSKKNLMLQLVEQGFHNQSKGFKYIYTIETMCGQRGLLLLETTLASSNNNTVHIISMGYQRGLCVDRKDDHTSLILRKELTRKLDEVLLKYRPAFQARSELSFSTQTSLKDLLSSLDDRIYQLIQLKCAFDVWYGLPEEDRHFLLSKFRTYYKLSNNEARPFQMSHSFCEVFIRDFVPVLSPSKN